MLHKIFLFQLIFLTGCFPNQKWCDDIIHYEITQKEIEFIPYYDEGDTINYLNIKNNKLHYAVSNGKTTTYRDTVWSENKEECENEGYKDIYDKVELKFEPTDIPNCEYIEYGYTALNNASSNFYIGLASIHYKLKYNVDDSTIIDDPDSGYPHWIKYYNRLNVNGSLYDNVFKIIGSYVSYDTIYYNLEYGILRMIDNEQNLDLVLVK